MFRKFMDNLFFNPIMIVLFLILSGIIEVFSNIATDKISSILKVHWCLTFSYLPILVFLLIATIVLGALATIIVEQRKSWVKWRKNNAQRNVPPPFVLAHETVTILGAFLGLTHLINSCSSYSPDIIKSPGFIISILTIWPLILGIILSVGLGRDARREEAEAKNEEVEAMREKGKVISILKGIVLSELTFFRYINQTKLSMLYQANDLSKRYPFNDQNFKQILVDFTRDYQKELNLRLITNYPDNWTIRKDETHIRHTRDRKISPHQSFSRNGERLGE